MSALWRATAMELQDRQRYRELARQNPSGALEGYRHSQSYG
jgi:hypothetical protein